jgi:DNA repair exonuclease SbcCD ATPase subunit
MNDMVNQLKQHEQDIHNLANEAVENARRIEYDNLLRELQSTLATKEQALQASERQLSVIENVTQQINELTDQIEAFKILVKELSPTEGLIAEGIFSFMRKFVADMNRVIKLVWTYPLEIKPCALESEGSLVLNYKFPIVVDKDSSTRKDVSLGSSAMLEIFDLVFRVCAAKAIGLGKLPLLLDEFGKGFDNVHKSSIVHMLGTLVDLNQVDQIFVISHEFSQYTALGTSEICVLHQSNVILPPGITFNKHVTMV